MYNSGYTDVKYHVFADSLKVFNKTIENIENFRFVVVSNDF